VGEAGEGICEAVHNKPGREEIHIEGLAVEADEKTLIPEEFLQIGQRGPFLGIIPGKDLLRNEGAAFEPPQAEE
jgi:hypothetical protein